MADGSRSGGMLSSYLGRWMSLLMFLVLAALAAGALLLEPDFPAHVAVRVGVCAFDSAGAGPALRSFASAVREGGGGDMTLVWLAGGSEPEGCDFYIMTFPQFLEARRNGRLDCLLVSSSRRDGALTMGVVVAREEDEPDLSRLALVSESSANGFISPLAAISESGVDLDDIDFETVAPGCPVCGEAVAFGVLLGRYGAGGMPLEELRRLERGGTLAGGELRVLLAGPALPDIVLAADPSTERWKSRGFAGRLPRIAATFPGPLSREMARLSMASFRPPSPGELETAGAAVEDVMEEITGRFP